ncbi:hypothetical protein [Propionivibrio dicarboxylicus]|uniref:hypothetical protein n=1 Tax=Propionivibrio dicarboxylicus TaxID=83767 RepID=UPI000A78AF15|nr:hypothetical protein [Propionivibrio dicarboxylicus]
MVLIHSVCRPGEKPEVLLLDNYAADKGTVDALQRLRGTRKLGSYACTTLIESPDYALTQMEAPPVQPEERREALRWALKDVVSFPVESACIDILDLPSESLPAGRSAGVLVVSASEQAVRDCVAPFVAAKVRLDVVDVPEMAQRNVAALVADENRGVVFLRVDETGMMLTLIFHGELVAVRRSEMTSLQLTGDEPTQRERVLERLVLELQRSLDNFDRQYSHIPISKVVVAAFPPVEGLIDALSQGTYVPLVALNLNGVLDFPGVPELKDPDVQAKYLLSIGAALRTSEAP